VSSQGDLSPYSDFLSGLALARRPVIIAQVLPLSTLLVLKV